jgi:methionyl-tRNA formyltransferase
MMQLLLLAPTSSSLYSRSVAHLIQAEDGMEVCGIVVRSILNWKRMRVEFRRDGPRLLQKIREKLISSPDASLGRDPEGMPSFARRIGLKPGSLRSDARRWGVPCMVVPDHNHPRVVALLQRLVPDLVVFTGGGLIRQHVLDLAGRGVLNCHSGILPRYRGMDVVEWPLLEANTQPEIGLTTHLMERGVDTGPILLQHQEGLRAGDTFESIRRRLEPHMPELVLETLRGLREGVISPQPQALDEGRQYFVMHPRLREVAAVNLHTRVAPDLGHS